MNKLHIDRSVIVLAFIFILALIIRIWKLNSLPGTMQEDEILAGYVGRYILHNGFDIYHNFWPLLYFNKFGDYYIIAPMYAAGISTYIFGLNAFAVRFPVALSGALTVVPTYMVTNELFRSKRASIIASFFLAILPWHIVMSRAMAEGIIGVFLLFSGIAFILHSLRSNTIKLLSIGTLILFSTYFIYHPFRVYVPLILLGIAYIYHIFEKPQQFRFIFLCYLICAICMTMYISTTPWGKGRLLQTSIFSDISGVKIRIQQQIFNTGPDHPLEARIFHNKVVGYSREYVTQYLSYFSPDFLLIHGGKESRYDLPDEGLIYFTVGLCVLFFVVAIPHLWRHDKRAVLFFIMLCIIAPMPAALTYIGSPNIHRSILLSALLPIAAGYGWVIMRQLPKGTLIMYMFSLVLLAEVAYFSHQYIRQFDSTNSMRRNDGYPQMAEYVRQHSSEYAEVYLPSEGNLALYYLFLKGDFAPKYSSQFYSDARIDKVENIHFLNTSCPSTNTEVMTQKDVLVVDKYTCAKNEQIAHVNDVKGISPLLGFQVYSTRSFLK